MQASVGRYGDDDAQLAGFGGNMKADGGLPRLYLMQLHGPRPLEVSTITRHNRVTQCLGALSGTEDFFLVVHEPTGEGLPTLAGAAATSAVKEARAASRRSGYSPGPDDSV